jgi:hypothetical protein
MYDGKVILLYLSFFDLFIHNAQSLCVFRSDDDTGGVSINAVAKRRREGVFLPWPPFVFLVQICLDMSDERIVRLFAVRVT